MSGWQELQTAMLADPSNRELRRVLMDALLEVNHPRAQLWLLTMNVDAFIDEHADELLGPLVDVIEPGFVFANAWLHGATLKPGAAWLAGHPLWATVEDLDAAGDAAVSGHPVMKSLRTLSHSAAPVERLASPKLERLVAHHTSRADAVALSSLSTLPLLTELHVRIAADDVAVLLPRVPSLTSFRVDVTDAPPEVAPSVFESVYRTGLERMAFSYFEGRLLLELSRSGATYVPRTNRDFHGLSREDPLRRQINDAHRFLMWQLRAFGVKT